jgi:spore germination protein KB
MSGTARISHQQLICAVGIFAHAATLVILPASMTLTAGPDAWLAIPVAMVLGGLPVALLLHGLARYHPQKTLGEIAATCLGRWGGKLVALVVGGFALFLTSMCVRHVMDFSTITLLRGTPMTAVGLVFLAVAAYAAYNGAEVICRLAVLALFSTTTFMGLMIIGLLPELDILRLLPVLDGGVGQVLQAAWPAAGWFGELLVFGQLIGFLDKAKLTGRGLFLGLLVATAILDLLVAGTLLVFGHFLAPRFVYPVYSLAQQVQAGQFLERLDVGLVSIWLASMMIKTAVALWAATVSFGQVLGLKNDRKLILPLGAGALGLTFIWPSIAVLIRYGTRGWTPTVYPLEIGLPTLLLLISWWQARRRRRQGAPVT